MTAALTPTLALAYLDQMSADIKAGVVFDMQGKRLAGPAALEAAARAFLAAADVHGEGAGREIRAASAGRDEPFEAVPAGRTAGPDGGETGSREPANPGDVTTLITARCPRGLALGARDARHAIVVAAGPPALARLVLHDLETVLSALGGGAARRVDARAPAASAEALLSAVPNPP
jgi:hypothetical protein